MKRRGPLGELNASKGEVTELMNSGKVATKKNEDLFMVDTVGDVAGESTQAGPSSHELMKVAQKLRRAPKPLRSLAILNERSAIPSLTSKNIQPSTSSKKTKVSGAEKERLRRIARRTAIASDGTGMGSAEVKTVKTAAADAWIDKAKLTAEGGFGEEAMNKPIVKAPITIARQREIYLQSQVEGQRGLETPDEGTSYNPSANSHARLISAAVEEELAQLEREGKEAERIALLGEVVIARKAQLAIEEHAMGMKIGPGEVDSDEDEVEAGPSRVVKPTKRKTQAQRNKAARNKEIAQLEAMEKTQKRLLREIGGLGGLKASAEKKMKQAAEAERLAKLAKKERERLGLQGGEKIGKHRVAKGRVTVQLGEDLAESLRQIKVGRFAWQLLAKLMCSPRETFSETDIKLCRKSR